MIVPPLELLESEYFDIKKFSLEKDAPDGIVKMYNEFMNDLQNDDED